MSVGRFIVLEGLGGSGTTTQARALSEALRARGHRVVETREPTDGPVGRLLRAELRAAAPHPRAMALLFAADRALHLAEVIEPALARGEVIVCDRYLMSSWVYQGLDCPADWVRTINTPTRWPDHTFVLEVASRTAMHRLEARDMPREVFETASIQARVEQGYAACLREQLPGVVALDGGASPADVTAKLVALCVEAGL